MSIGTLAGRLEWAIRHRGWTVSDLARELGAKPQVVAPWLVGTPPGGRYLVELPGVLGVSGHWLLTGDGPVEPPGVDPTLEAARAEAAALTKRAIVGAVREALDRVEATEDLRDLLADVGEALEQDQQDRRKRRGGQGRTG